MNEQTQRPKSKIYSEPAEMVSDAFITYMYQRSEIFSFNEYYHRLAKKAIEAETNKPDLELYKEYRGQSIYFLENFLCKMSDLFEVYLDELIWATWHIKPDFLAAREKEMAKIRLSDMGFENALDGDVLFEASTRFGRRDKNEIAQHFKDSIGFDMVEVSGSWSEMLLCSAVRNIIVHKRSIMDEKFVHIAKNHNCPFPLEVGVSLAMPEAWVMQLTQSVDQCICAIDDKISERVQVNKRNRFGHIWLARSYLDNPLNT